VTDQAPAPRATEPPDPTPDPLAAALQDDFWSKVDMSGGPNACWPFLGYLNPSGYGRYRGADRRGVQAHRQAYEDRVGPIPAGLTLDHLCRNRACANPAHLEPVTQRENVLRGDGESSKNARRTHCIHGHEFTPENTARFAYAPRSRHCRACRAERSRTLIRDPNRKH